MSSPSWLKVPNYTQKLNGDKLKYEKEQRQKCCPITKKRTEFETKNDTYEGL
jgi:hypothetical protein